MAVDATLMGGGLINLPEITCRTSIYFGTWCRLIMMSTPVPSPLCYNTLISVGYSSIGLVKNYMYTLRGLNSDV